MMAVDRHPAALLAMLVAGLVLALGAWLCWLVPGRSPIWLVAMFLLPGAWAMQRVLRTFGVRVCESDSDRHKIAMAMLGGGLMLALPLAAVLIGRLGWIDAPAGELPDRAWGLILGGLLVVYANHIPKHAGPAPLQSMLRFIGWTLVLCGLAYSAVWLLVPLPQAGSVAELLVLSALALVLARVGLHFVNRRASHSGS